MYFQPANYKGESLKQVPVFMNLIQGIIFSVIE
jgi:hypothetical protein